VRALGLAWVGVFPERFDETVAFLQEVVGLSYGDADDQVTMLHTARGDSVEVFRPHARYDFAATGPIPGFLVEDASVAARELAEAGVELFGEVERWENHRWQHFRAPDGSAYEVTSGDYDPLAPGPGLAWAGSRSTRAEEMAEFGERVLGMERVGEEPAMVHLRMANGDGFEVFRPDDPTHDFLDTGPTVAFGVADLDAVLRRLEGSGAERFADGVRTDGVARWVHFRAPDGCVYQLHDRGGPST
jgi:predicted enzyme related to lactoylglutathione lyase